MDDLFEETIGDMRIRLNNMCYRITTKTLDIIIDSSLFIFNIANKHTISLILFIYFCFYFVFVIVISVIYSFHYQNIRFTLLSSKIEKHYLMYIDNAILSPYIFNVLIYFMIGFMLILLKFVYYYESAREENMNLLRLNQEIALGGDNDNNDDNDDEEDDIEYTQLPFHIRKICYENIVRNEEVCPICIECIDDMNNFFVTTCGHYYHNTCINISLLNGNTDCPLCRVPIEY